MDFWSVWAVDFLCFSWVHRLLWLCHLSRGHVKTQARTLRASKCKRSQHADPSFIPPSQLNQNTIQMLEKKECYVCAIRGWLLHHDGDPNS